MKLGCVIIYVKDVCASVDFFEKAFGLKKKCVCESGYAEIDTGDITLAFVDHKSVKEKFGFEYRAADESNKPLGMEIALEVDCVKSAYEKAISCGARPLKEPSEMPWKQTLAYVVCPDGTLVDLCSKMEK